MAVYRSRNALAGPLTPARIDTIDLPLSPPLRRGYRTEDVDAILHRLTYELTERTRQLRIATAENRRIKTALRNWQSERIDPTPTAVSGAGRGRPA
ncbi:hypothetical protein O7600_28770 [Micromonospora sp. WMMA1998]|uniref:hypothetical protein n=1 Tax=Micromonospora sp. WMMA1998 TaxID=3015167 RepID=UPI00248B65FE|nr:hypothetical protein [Micromonospora sp. WMMA1998]WBC15008.1 hypothetical protein O7600_28770 [Micromonospora sp. WMMA1998]